MPQADRQIFLLATGGTIAIKGRGGGDPDMLDGEALVESVRGLSGVVVEKPFNLPGSHLEFHHLSTLSRRLDEIAASHPDAGLVLTMGTDTLEEAAYFLDLTYTRPNPVVVTGAMRGPGLAGADRARLAELFPG